MPRGLRRKLTSYGDQDFSLFLRKAFIKAMGYSDDALDRPVARLGGRLSGGPRDAVPRSRPTCRYCRPAHGYIMKRL